MGVPNLSNNKAYLVGEKFVNVRTKLCVAEHAFKQEQFM